MKKRHRLADITAKAQSAQTEHIRDSRNKD